MFPERRRLEFPALLIPNKRFSRYRSLEASLQAVVLRGSILAH